MSQRDIGRLVGGGRSNTLLAWVFVGLAALAGIESVLTNDPLWAAFTASAVVLAVIPPIAFRSWRVTLPWEVLGLAAIVLWGRAIAPSAELAVYVSVAALALIVAVELDVFTPVEMTYSFAVVFVVITTMAAAGLWAIARWGADILFGTGFLTTDQALMWEFVDSAIAGVGAGVLFEWYFRRRVRLDERYAVESGS